MKIILAGCLILALPGYYLIRILRRERLKKRKQLQLALAYDRLVKQARFSIDHSELLNGKVIALDRRNKKLLFIDHTNAEKQEECVALPGIESCRVTEIKSGPDLCITQICLELKHKWNNKISRFCFYDDSHDPITELPALAKRARFWKHRIHLHKYPGSVSLELEYVL